MRKFIFREWQQHMLSDRPEVFHPCSARVMRRIRG